MHLRAILGFAFASCLVACLGEVTSSGGRDEAKSNLVDENAEAARSEVDEAATADAGTATDDASSAPPFCGWYSWMPEAGAGDNRYVLPENAPTNSDPGFIPANWDLDWARVELLSDKSIGNHKASAADCLDDHGWYFADEADQATATHYSLCPKTSSAVTQPEDFRLSARSCH